MWTKSPLVATYIIAPFLIGQIGRRIVLLWSMQLRCVKVKNGAISVLGCQEFEIRGWENCLRFVVGEQKDGVVCLYTVA